MEGGSSNSSRGLDASQSVQTGVCPSAMRVFLGTSLLVRRRLQSLVLQVCFQSRECCYTSLASHATESRGPR